MRLFKTLVKMWKTLFVVFIVSTCGIYAGVIKCKPGEVLDNCPSNCTDSCLTRDGELSDCRRSYSNDCPPAKCVCQFNYRRDVNGECVPTEQCPPFDCPRPNEEYNACPFLCPTDECSQSSPNGACPYLGVMLLVLECSPSCRCKRTYWRKEGVCVPYEEC